MKNVFLNIDDSGISYRYQNYKFYFSSRATRERFIKKLESYINEETMKFKIKYKVEINEESFKLMFAFVLYSKTEKRGIKIEEVENKKFIKDIPSFEVRMKEGE